VAEINPRKYQTRQFALAKQRRALQRLRAGFMRG
jgi:hypothetical protein